MQYTNPPQQVSADQTKRASQGRVIGMTILLFVLATIVAFIVFSVVTGLVVTLFIEDSEMLDFDDLGTIIAALLAGGAAMVVSYVIAAVLFVRLLLPAGQRGLPIATVLILPPVLLFALGALSAALG